MPSLKDLKVRIASVKATKKITSAMKMVAASKLRRAQQQVEENRAYAQRMLRMIQAVRESLTLEEDSLLALTNIEIPRIMRGTGKEDVHLVVVVTSDRGLCGGLNSSVIREVRRHLETLKQGQKKFRLICVGRKGRELLKSEYGTLISETYQEIGRKRSVFSHTQEITQRIMTLFEEEAFDVCTLFYNEFKSVLVQEVRQHRFIPIQIPKTYDKIHDKIHDKTKDSEQHTSPTSKRSTKILPFEFEPNEQEVLSALVPLSLNVQMYWSLLESIASEQGARITAMDNATRNASDMIDRLTLLYNRTRQAYITKELIEIISGAEAIS